MRDTTRKRAGQIAAVLSGLAALLFCLAAELDRRFPPPLEPGDFSAELRDRNGATLNVLANSQGRWRLPVELDAVDPQFLRLLIAYEDKRFYNHHGVDFLALGRAAWQWLGSGRIVSGGSTITMQLARLLEPRRERSIAAKLRQTLRAWQIERRLSKEEILERYLALTPYGGNIEGIRAATLGWFGTEPGKLSPAQTALLIVLPQSPERRRPDRFPREARNARDRAVDRLISAGLISEAEKAGVIAEPVPARRRPMPQYAAHLARKAFLSARCGMGQGSAACAQSPRAILIDADLQIRLENLARRAARSAGGRHSVAILLADAATGEILASIGSANENDWNDMTIAPRSPGSTLKPFVYGLAIEDGLVLLQTLISDRPTDFDGYRPTNFDMRYQGDVTIAQALQMSLNVPAVKLTEAVSPLRVMARFERAGVTPKTALGGNPGLGLALGGVSLSLTELVQLYANLLAPSGTRVRLGDGLTGQPVVAQGQPMLDPAAAWQVADILTGTPPPPGRSAQRRFAYKTGTSYGYRDAWAIGFDGRHVIGVWTGRPDNGAVPGMTGIGSAAPILFEALEIAALPQVRWPDTVAATGRMPARLLPPALRRFDRRGRIFSSYAGGPLEIVFPVTGSEVEISSGERPVPLSVKLTGGVPPYRLLANGAPAGPPSRRANIFWQPAEKGAARLTVIDGAGQFSSVQLTLR